MKVTLGGKTWDLAPLPWRVVKSVQPKLLDLWATLAGLGADNVIRVGEADLDKLSDCVLAAVSYVDPTMTRGEFDELPITAREMVSAVPAVAIALGLREAASKEEADSAGKASTGPG